MGFFLFAVSVLELELYVLHRPWTPTSNGTSFAYSVYNGTDLLKASVAPICKGIQDQECTYERIFKMVAAITPSSLAFHMWTRQIM